MNKTEFTQEEKITILKKHGWEVQKGFCFSNPTSQDYDNHFVSEEEVNNALKLGAQYYVYIEDFSASYEINNAFDVFYDNIADNIDGNPTDEEIVLYIRKEFLE
jgi:hypothetical protein